MTDLEREIATSTNTNIADAAAINADVGVDADAEENMTLPLELIDQCIGKRIRVYLRDNHYYEATLVGFDDLVNLVLEDIEEYGVEENEAPNVKKMLLSSRNITIISLID